MIGLLITGRNCSPGSAQAAARPRMALENVCLKCTGLWPRGAADLIDVWIPVTYLTSQSPRHEQARAPRIFHLHRHTIAARIFDLERHAIVQALVPRIFHLNHHSTEQVFAPRVFRLKRRNLATRIFHLNHRVIRQSLAPDHFFSKLRQACGVLRDADCSMLHTSFWF